VRKSAVYILGKMNAVDSKPKIKNLLKDPDDRVQLSAAASLGRLKDNAGLSVAQHYLSAQDPRKRREAVEIYGLVGSGDDLGMLEKILKNDENRSVRNAAELSIRLINRRTDK
ncbi:MAG: hypothetical protein GF384_02430, partial [Elusimicrobia bacterium]|nr:hypothetical protein [Elusimicrobiota bacterium]MBD3411824.1 hypothetical protein [Elusimicrobiota bacterium]